MLLSDLGAEVVRIDRQGGNGWPNPVVDRGRATLAIDLRSEEGLARCLDVIAHADVVIEGFRPGTMERLGLGPDVLLARNPRLVFGRITGWGQTGPLAKAAGHDINYIALTGALAAMGRPGEPATPPLNLVGDFGGGSMLLAFGIMAALRERERSGKGQVIDAAIVDGVSSLMSRFAGLLPSGRIDMSREGNMLGGAAPFYRCYICADGQEIALGPLEPQFYAELLKRIDAPADFFDKQNDASLWPERSMALAKIFRTRTASEWCVLLEGTDACFAPVVALKDAPDHPHMAERGVYVAHDGLRQVAPVPRFSRTPGAIQAAGDGAAVVDQWNATPRKGAEG
ncbi:CaiB/BaiF CoA transferase family protein [Caulobacter sp. DWR1-3-2b1]|uniref:CaiB/BaiF CoA transferase family protein n=1 Tax=Caulobacter sp. DWR1-3-2b1 TaxID=2804670 RepID=UPI003CFB2C86